MVQVREPQDGWLEESNMEAKSQSPWYRHHLKDYFQQYGLPPSHGKYPPYKVKYLLQVHV